MTLAANHSPHPKDVVRCGECHEEMLPQVTGLGYAAFYCGQCRTLEVIYPRPATPVPREARLPDTSVSDRCVICGDGITTVIRRGPGSRVTMCARHGAEERAHWSASTAGLCIVPGCVANAVCRGRCNKCYLKWRRAAGRG